eukprot:1519663-Rhodomonas_salina.3
MEKALRLGRIFTGIRVMSLFRSVGQTVEPSDRLGRWTPGPPFPDADAARVEVSATQGPCSLAGRTRSRTTSTQPEGLCGEIKPRPAHREKGDVVQGTTY